MSFVRKVTHQILGPAKPFNVIPSLQNQEQKSDGLDLLFVGALTRQESKAFTSTTPLRQLGDYQNIANQKKLIAQNSESDFSTISDDEYFIYAPVIGKMRTFVGDPYLTHPEIKARHATIEDVVKGTTRKIIEYIDLETPIDWKAIQEAIDNYPELRRHLVISIFCSTYKPFRKEYIEKDVKPVLNELVKRGVLYENILPGEAVPADSDYDYGKFEKLVTIGLDGDALNLAIARTDLGGPRYPSHPLVDESFSGFAEVALLCIPRGANINTVQYCNEAFGSFLHKYLAYEMNDPVKLIQFIESLKDENLPGSSFNYELCDGYDRTPLLLAIITGREDAALELLKLAKEKGINVGIDQPDSQGRTPLLIAAALGLNQVVEKLLKCGANPLAKDLSPQKNGLTYYSQLSKEGVHDLLSPLMHPYRCNGISGKYDRRSYLYWNDEHHSPVCLYKQGEEEKTGDGQIPHLVVLSNHKDYIERVHEAIQSAKDQGEEKLAKYLQEQLDDIKDARPVIEICLEKQKVVQHYLETPAAQDLIAHLSEQFGSKAETLHAEPRGQP